MCITLDRYLKKPINFAPQPINNMKKLFYAFGLLCLSLPAFSQVTIFEQNAKFGLKDASGTVLISAEYDNMTQYSEYSYYGEPYPTYFVGNKGGTKTVTTFTDSIWGYSGDNYEYKVTGTKTRDHVVIKGGSYFVFNSAGQQINADGYENLAFNFAAPVLYDYGEPYGYKFIPLDEPGMAKEYNRTMVKYSSGIMVKKNGKWGLMNNEPRMVIPFVSDGMIEEMTTYDQNFLYKVKKGKNTVLYSSEGKAISGEYEFIDYFNTWENYTDYSQSVAKVVKGGKTGYIRIDGKEMIPPKYDYLIKVSGNIFIFNKGGKIHRYEWLDSSAFYTDYYYYDPEDNYQPQVNKVKDSLMKGGKFGVIKDGKEIIPASYSFVEYDYNSGYFFGHTGGKEPIDPKSNSYSYGYYDGYYEGGYNNSADYNHYLMVERPTETKRAVIDEFGKVKVKDIEEITLNYINASTREVDENGLFVNKPKYYHLIINKGKNGLLNADFKEVIPAKFKSITFNYNLNNGTVVVNDDNNKYGVYSVQGKAVTGMDYAAIYNGDKFYYYNKGGKWTDTETSYYDYYTDSTFTYTVTNLKGGKYGVLKDGTQDMGAIYDTIYVLSYSSGNYGYDYEYDYGYSSSRPIITFKKNGLMGIFASNGTEGFPAQFTSITYDYSSRKLTIMKDNLYGLASITGKILIDPVYTSLYSAGYNYYSGGSNAFVGTNQEGYQGIIDTAGNVLFGFQYNWIDSYGWNSNNELIKVSRNNKYGFADREGNEVLACEHDDINEYFNYTSKIAIVTKDGKKGLYDRATRSWTTQPKYTDVLLYEEQVNKLTKVVIGGEIYWDSLSYTNKVRGGKCGYIDSTGKEIIPPVYDNVSYNNEIELYMCNKGKGREYYDLSGKKINDGESRWMNSYLGRKMMENQKIVELGWTSANGPVGADATAFYYDEDGTYWLGTGSSGGVYRSTDQGKSWVETNNGIGPRHIIFIDKLNDTLFIVDQGAGSYSAYEIYSGEFGYFESVHYWNTNTKSWSLIPDSRKYNIANELYSAANTKRYETTNPQAVSGYGPGVNYFPAYLNNVYYYNYPYNYVGSYNASTYGYDTVVSKGMPKDCYNNAAGNIFKVEGDNYILLSKSGVYKFSSANSVSPLSENGLKASDITQIGTTPSGAVIVREGTSDIWKYENNTWTKLLDAYKMNEQLGLSTKGYYTGNFSIDKKGNILVPFRGNIYEFSSDGNMKLLAEAGEITKFTEYSSNGFTDIEFIQAIRDKNNKLWILTGASGYYSNSFAVLEMNDAGKLMYADSTFKTGYGAPFLFADKKGNVWKYHEYSIEMAGNAKSTSLKTNYWDFNFNKVATGSNGEVAVVSSYSAISIFVPEKSKWIEINLKGAGNISSMEYDARGNLMVSTNYEFEYFCGEDSKIKKAEPTIGYIEFSMDGVKMKALNNPVNPRVLSLYPSSGGMYVGTSGSGLQMVTKK
jgi:hypothetical protein